MIDDIDVIDEIEIDDAPAYPLAIDEANALSRCEAVIARGVQTFIEVGEALAEIRDGKLYRADFATFEHYCRNKWGIGDSRARQLIGAAVVAREIETVTNVTLPNEGQARAIAKAAPADRPAVLDRATALAGDKPRTAKHIAQAAAEIARPDLPIEFAIAKRRFESLGHVLSEAWDGHTQRFVVRKDGGTGVVMLWPDVVSKLASLEAEPRDAPDHGASEGAAAYQAKEARDAGRIQRARNLIAAHEYDAARQVLDQVEVATYARDQLLATIPTGRQITLALTPHDCAALLKEAKAFEHSGLTKKLPAISAALLLLVEAIKGAK